VSAGKSICGFLLCGVGDRALGQTFCYFARKRRPSSGEPMRRYIFVSAFIAGLMLLSMPIDALNRSHSVASQTEQSVRVSDRDASSGALAFFTDVKRTLWEIPEPATLLLLGAGLATASRFIQRRRRSF
jgi:hypothetical protein